MIQKIEKIFVCNIVYQKSFKDRERFMAIFAYAYSLVWQLFFILVGIFGIGFVIAFHEFGHFIFCKLFGIKVPSFSIGMGPRVITKKIGDTVFALSALPLGGYVEIAGEDDDTGDTDSKNLFANKPYYQKMMVIGGGILCNLIFAYAAFTMLYWTGAPKSPLTYPKHASTVIDTIQDDSPAQNGGLKDGDIIQKIDTLTVSNPEQLLSYIKERPNQSVNLTIERNQTEVTVPVTLGEQTVKEKQFGFLGVGFAMRTYSLWQSIKQGINTTHETIRLVCSSLKNIFSKRSVENIGGPLMIISQTIKGIERGFKIFLLLLAYISINLAVLNLIPLPILDGGQALFCTIEAIIRRPLPEKAKMYIHYACWIGMLLLTLVLSIKDISRTETFQWIKTFFLSK